MRSDTLSRTFEALAAPTRRAILERLSRGPATVGELARPFEMSLPAVSRHLGVLERAGLVRREARAQWRRCHLETAPLAGAQAWIARRRAFREAGFAALAKYLDEATPGDESDDGQAPANDG